jgi:hypothetical protein
MPDMLVKLYSLPEVEPFIQKMNDRKIEIRTAMAYEKFDVVEWVRNSFGRVWASECDVAFSNHPISCFIAIEGGIIVGFACYDSTCKDFFGPMGVSEMKRGIGIGKALLLSCLHTMASSGYAYAIIGATGPGDFYTETVGAAIIEGSSPGIYRDQLKKNEACKPEGE